MKSLRDRVLRKRERLTEEIAELIGQALNPDSFGPFEDDWDEIYAGIQPDIYFEFIDGRLCIAVSFGFMTGERRVFSIEDAFAIERLESEPEDLEKMAKVLEGIAAQLRS